MQIFFSRRHAASYMPLRLICIQNDSGLSRKHGSDTHQPLRYILVYRGFAYPHLVRRLSDRRSGVNDIICCFNCPFFYVSLQRKAPAYSVFTVYAGTDSLCILICLLYTLNYWHLGNLTTNLEPISSLDTTCIVPPCASTIHLAMERPSPEPPVSLFLASSER